MRILGVFVLLLLVSLSARSQTLKHFPTAPQYTDQKTLNHLESLEGEVKAVRKSMLKVSFYGWSNAEVGAAAQQNWDVTSKLLEETISNIDDIRAQGRYSIRKLFVLYSASSSVMETAAYVAQGLCMMKKGQEVLCAKVLSTTTDVGLTLKDINDDLMNALDLQGDMLITALSQPSCNVELKEQ
jgi:hypothetical protein